MPPISAEVFPENIESFIRRLIPVNLTGKYLALEPLLAILGLKEVSHH